MSVVVVDKPVAVKKSSSASSRHGSLKEGRIEKKRQRQLQKIQSRRDQQRAARKVNEASSSRLASNVGSTRGLLARQKCVLLIGDGSDEAFMSLRQRVEKQLEQTGIRNSNLIVEAKLGSMTDDLNSSPNIPPQRNISHAFVLMDAHEFVGNGDGDDAIGTVEALEKICKAKLPTNKKKITVVITDVLALQKEEKFDIRDHQPEEDEEVKAESDAVLAEVESASVVSSAVVGEEEEEQLLLTAAQYTSHDSLVDESLWRGLKKLEIVQQSLFPFKRIDGLWSMHQTLNEVQLNELQRRIDAAALEIDPEAVRAAKANIFQRCFTCLFCCGPAASAADRDER
eukprot:TRINITY_DN1586_c0_g1_i1.p1 TRINITY_DN1586_c0_g1~~TRINITY_DN1586_c0_g1_i1.p1  ORF type:complete len:341 (-),score=90.20 TRINITY_DN1586_c0_g1_i1:42-1064(-)